MRVAYWPDVHLRRTLLDDFIHKNYDNFDKIVLTGDIFDSFHDTPYLNMEMARYLKYYILHDSKFDVIPGNHDNYYRWGYAHDGVLASGFSWEKNKAINSILKETDWDTFKNYTYYDGWLASHAGFAPSMFLRQEGKFDLNELDTILKRAYELIRKGHFSNVFGIGAARGGNQAVGGPFWQCWDEMIPLPGVKQIVGHTPHKRPKIKFYNKEGLLVRRDFHNEKEYPQDTISVNLDTHNQHLGIVTDGKLTVHRVQRFL